MQAASVPILLGILAAFVIYGVWSALRRRDDFWTDEPQQKRRRPPHRRRPR